jgi:mono/diheme cytochrome c family protein
MKNLLKLVAAFVGIATLLIFTAFMIASSHMSNGRQKIYNIKPVEFSGDAKGDWRIGKRIIEVRNGCIDCHGNDLSGKNIMNDSNFAVINGPNITPHSLKDWTDGEIARTIRHGIGKDGRALILMPSHEYARLSENDVISVVNYLRRVPPIAKENGEIAIGPVMKGLYFANKMPTLFPAEIIDHRTAFPVKPDEKASKDFGRYLVQSACIGCHGTALKGGPIIGGDPAWPEASDISSVALANWSVSDFENAMRSGINPSGHKIRLPMPISLTSKMSELELGAIWKFLTDRTAL